MSVQTGQKMGVIKLPGNAGAFIFVFLFSALKRSHGLLGYPMQTPGEVEVMVGQPVTLECNVKDSITITDGFYCHEVSWLKVSSTTGKMEMVSFANYNLRDKTCEVTIYNTTSKDSGIYYCLVKPDKYLLLGTGSSLTVTYQANFSMELFSSSDTRNDTVSFICRVMDVMSSEVHIVWIINGTEHAGLIESVWTKDKFTKNHRILQSQFRMQVSEWQPGAQCTCLVEARGVNISESLQCTDMSSCSYLLYGISGSVLFAIIMTIFTAVILCHSRKVRSDSKRVENRGPNSSHREMQDQRSSETEVYYATLDQIHLEQISRSRIK